MRATLTRTDGETIAVHTTTEHYAVSYGHPIWVDDEDNPYCQVGGEQALADVYGLVITNITEDRQC